MRARGRLYTHRPPSEPIAPHPTNGDEARYPNKIGSDTRGLPHDKRGEVDQAAWQALFATCQSGDPADFEKIPLGGPRKLVNPIGPQAVSLSGINATQTGIPSGAGTCESRARRRGSRSVLAGAAARCSAYRIAR